MPSGSSKDFCHQDKNIENGHCAFEDLDHSVLQQPLNLGVTNIKQVLKCIQSGSREVKDIILNECNVIYECKACVGLFRSLANFIYHKRCYCKKHLCEGMLLFENFDETETVVVQPEAPVESTVKTAGTSKLADCTVNLVKTDIAQVMECDVPKDETPATEASVNLKDKSSASDDHKVKVKSEPKKTENSMISRRTRDKNTQPKIKVTPEEPPIKCAKIISAKLIQKETEKLTTKRDSQPDTSNKGTKKIELSKFTGTLEKTVPTFPKIIFKAIDANPHAVYQSSDKKKLESYGVNSKYENSAVQAKVDNDKLIIVLKKDAKSDNPENSKSTGSSKLNDMDKLSDFHLTRRKRLMSRSDCNVHELRCLTCKTQFMSLKTLYFHMLSLHSKKRLYYPCPFCKTLFVQMYGVTRHLISIHNKTKEQINKLRDVIKKKSVWKRIDDVNPICDGNVSPINYQIKTDPQPEVKIETAVETVESEIDDPDSLKTVIKVGKNVTLHQCAKCNRVFGRKSSQVSHQKFCIMNSSVKTETTDFLPSPPQPINPPMVSFLTSPTKPSNMSKPSSVLHVRKAENSQVRKVSVERETPAAIKISIRPKRGAKKQMHKDFVNSQTLKWRSANRIETNTNTKAPPPSIKKAKGKNLEKKVLNIMDAESLNCLKCSKTFSSYSNLRRHVAIHVGWTRFKCKYCEYQAYNKSQCWAHIQKTHSVDDEDMEKSIVNLVSSNSSGKKSSLPVTPVSNNKRNVEASPKSSNSKSSASKIKISKKKILSTKNTGSEKKQVQAQKKVQPEAKKQIVEIDLEEEPAESKKEKSLLPAICIAKLLKKEIAQIKRDKPQATITIQKFPKKEIIDNNKKDKPQHIIPLQKLTIPDYKRDTNYKSVTTSNPTTIILSKKIPSSNVQSIVTISPESMSSPSKISPIRTSPRKNEIKGSEEKLVTTLVTRSNTNTKITPIQIKLPERSNSVEDISQDSADKNCSKKEKLISEWFPKKDLSSTNVRRESAPLIIGLVPAANAGVNARAKNPAIPFEKSNS